VDPTVLVEGGKNEKQEPAYGADVLRLWVSSVDYSADVPLGPGIVKQLADVYRKVRNTARYLLGNLHGFDPRPQAEGGHAVPIAELPLLDRWMLQRTAALIDAVSADFDRYEFYRFFQALQNFCVVDLSNFYLDIAKDRLYVSGANDFRRRSCQTVLSLIVEQLAVLIAPVLCHMAEDIWQNLPYKVDEASVFERRWPKKAPQEWTAEPLAINPEKLNIEGNSTESKLLEVAFTDIKLLRMYVNQKVEALRSKGEIGAALETCVELVVSSGLESRSLRESIAILKASNHPEVDNLSDIFITSFVELTEGPEGENHGALTDFERNFKVKVRSASGEKCDRCWHYERDVTDHTHKLTLSEAVTGRLCGRCRGILDKGAHAAV
jgi:isoleucyl-tRNA synthetase